MTLTQEKALNYYGLPEEYSAQENSKAVIVPVPYAGAKNSQAGTKLAPEAILFASQQVQHFDDELWVEPYKIGIQTVGAVSIEPLLTEVEKPFEQLSKVIEPIVEFGKFPVIIGGERPLTLGAVSTCAERFPNLSILQIDSHANLRKPHEDHPYSRSSLSYHLYNSLPRPLITQVGVRSISADEVAWLEQDEPRVNIFWARQQNSWNFDEIIDTLSDHVYLTINVDGLDPSIMPATATPEPGGITWSQVIELIKRLCVRKHVVAADVVELAPIKDLPGPDLLIAKLIYKIIAYRFAMELGVTKKYL